MTANAVSSLSLDPPLVLFCPAKRARFSQLLPRAARIFDQFSARRAGGAVDLFRGRLEGGRDPRPIVSSRRAACRAWKAAWHRSSASKRDVYEGGDHWLVTLEVRQLHRGVEPLRPLLFFEENTGESTPG